MSEPKLLDLAFAMDCTGSMSSHIKQAQKSIKMIVGDIVAKEHAMVHLALVEYRDHPVESNQYVTRVLDFTPLLHEMQKRLDKSTAHGGGDEPEAVADGLDEVLKLNWRDEATKVCVFISDAPPHGLIEFGDTYRNGCPCNIDPMVVSRQIAEKGITVYMVGCGFNIVQYKDWFSGVAHITGGQYVPLESANLLANVIIGGAQEEISLQNLMTDVGKELEKQLAAAGDSVEQAELEKKIFEKLRNQGATSKKLKHKSALLPPVSDRARLISEAANMKEASRLWKNKKDEPESEDSDDEAADETTVAPVKAVAPPTKKAKVAAAPKPAKKKTAPVVTAVPPFPANYPMTRNNINRMRPATAADTACTEKEEAATSSDAEDESKEESGTKDEFSVDESAVEYAQVQRMVQKSLMMKKLKAKCTPTGKKSK